MMEYKTIRRKVYVNDVFKVLYKIGFPHDLAVKLLKDIPTVPSGYYPNWISMNEYQAQATRTINISLTADEITRHALFGLAAEAGEILGLYQKELQGHTVDIDKLTLEIGDCLWMLAELCTSLGIDLGDVAQKNIDKLKARYPDGFDAERSIHRQEGDQ